jgi:hypothetical protein
MNRQVKEGEPSITHKDPAFSIPRRCYNPFMHDERTSHLPNLDRLSTLTATVLLTFALSRFVDLPASKLGLQLPGFYLQVQIDPQSIVSLLIAGLTAAGMNWLLREHPGLDKQAVLEHQLLPGLTAWVINLPLSQIPFSPLWWIGFGLGGVLLTLVLIAEYIVVDPDDERFSPAAAVLTVLSFALYLVLASALRFAGWRLFQILPVLAIAVGLVSLRVLRFRLHQQWSFLQAGLVTLITTQIAAALHYWPITPVSFGLALLGPAYALTTLTGNLAEGEPLPQAGIEPFVVLGFIWLAAILIR